MKKTILTVLFAAALKGQALAETSSAFACLQNAARSGGLASCLGETARDGGAAAVAAGSASAGAAEALKAGAPRSDETQRAVTVPTPTGYTSADKGSLKAGFFNGLDSGFKSVFIGLEFLPVLGAMASGAPFQSNAGTNFFLGVGTVLAVPAAIVAGAVGAPLGAVAGMIAEKVSPGSTENWFTF